VYKRKIRVNISDARVSGDACDVLVTYSLGLCIGVCLYDRAAKIGGMLHYLLPNSGENPQRARERPLMYADTRRFCQNTKILFKRKQYAGRS